MFLLPGYNYTGYILMRPPTVWMDIFKISQGISSKVRCVLKSEGPPSRSSSYGCFTRDFLTSPPEQRERTHLKLSPISELRPSRDTHLAKVLEDLCFHFMNINKNKECWILRQDCFFKSQGGQSSR